MKLTGDRCQCSKCKQYFNSTAAFNKHRVGEHRVQGDRRCLSVQEMSERGFQRNLKGYWITSGNPKWVQNNQGVEMRTILITALVISLSGCAVINQGRLIDQLKGAGCEIQSLTFQKEQTTVHCMGFNVMMYEQEAVK